MSMIMPPSFNPSSYIDAINLVSQNQSQVNQQYNNQIGSIQQQENATLANYQNNFATTTYNLNQFTSNLNRQTDLFLGDQKANAAASGFDVNSKSFATQYSDTLTQSEQAAMNEQHNIQQQRNQLALDTNAKLSQYQNQIRMAQQAQYQLGLNANEQRFGINQAMSSAAINSTNQFLQWSHNSFSNNTPSSNSLMHSNSGVSFYSGGK